MPEQKLTKEELAWLKMTEQQMIDELSSYGSMAMTRLLEYTDLRKLDVQYPGILKQWVSDAIAVNVKLAYEFNNSPVPAAFAGRRLIVMPDMIKKDIQRTLKGKATNRISSVAEYDPVGNVQAALEFGVEGGRKKKRKSKKKSRRSKKKRKSKKKSRRTRRK